jgi:hypothetical protein
LFFPMCQVAESPKAFVVNGREARFHFRGKVQ